MNRIPLIATAIVLLNVIAGGVHGYSHVQNDVPLAPWQQVFVLSMVFVLPLLGMGLYWTPCRRTAALVLGGSMVAATIFGIYFHFVADTVDHVHHRDAHSSGLLFVVSAIILVPAGLLGIAFALWSWPRAGKVST